MTLPIEQLVAIVGLMVGAISVGRVLVKIGEVLRRLDDLEGRHREGITDSRQRLQALELALAEVRQRLAAPTCPPTERPRT